LAHPDGAEKLLKDITDFSDIHSWQYRFDLKKPVFARGASVAFRAFLYLTLFTQTMRCLTFDEIRVRACVKPP
jgi:hypothetical protein